MAFISSRAISFIDHVCDVHGVDRRSLREGLAGLEGAQLPSQVPWSHAAVMLERLERAIGGPAELESAGLKVNEVASGSPLRAVLSRVASPVAVYRAICTWFGPRLVPFIKSEFEVRPDGTIDLVMVLPDELAPSPQFFRYAAGSLRAAPAILGRAHAVVEAEIGPRRAHYRITPPPDVSWLARMRRTLSAVLAPDGAVQALAAQQVLLGQSYAALVSARDELERLLEQLPLGIFVLGGEAILHVNLAGAAWLEAQGSAALAGTPLEAHAAHTDREAVAAWVRGQAPGDAGSRAFGFVSRSGKPLVLELMRPRPIGYAGTLATLVVARDITATRGLEEQLRQSQKMEAVGSLAGGVAHDFNNLLTVVLSQVELLTRHTNGHAVLDEGLLHIREAGEKAAELTRQLLAFSRRQVMRPVVLDLNQVVEGMEKLLRRLIGEHLSLVVKRAETPMRVLADRGQLEQVLLNLVVNARDAMPKGGTVELVVDEVVLDEHFAREHEGLSPGRHVRLSVIDQGVGMDAATLARVFEPFFTTKPAGKGTGLGLSTVFGIVRQSNGQVLAHSTPGQGSTFTVYLPVGALPGSSGKRAASPKA